jgi:phosphopantetheine--protein transferase-like protein
MGLGIDVVDVDRAEAMLSARRRRVLDRLLTADELAYVMRLRHPARHLAVRLAAKEAVYKALQVLPGSRPIGWREIEVVRGEHGRPSVQLHGLARELMDRAGDLSIHLSLTHSDRSAVAAAILER